MPSTLVTRLAVFAAGSVLFLGAACGDSSDPATTTSSSGGDSGGAGGRAGDGGDASTTDAVATSSAAGSTSSGGSTTSASSSASSSSSSSTGTGGTGGAGGGFASCGIGMPPGGEGGGAPGGRVRVVAANLSTGNNQSYDGGQGVRILQGLDADIVLMQEMNRGNSSAAAIGGLVDDVCSGECNYMRGPQEQIPNGVLSRLPILDCGSWIDPEVSNRNFVWARIDVPGSPDLWAISVHLLTENASTRGREADALLGHIRDAIPASDLVVVGGDLNTSSRTEAALTKLAALFETGAPHPEDQDGNGDTNAGRDKPYDWVLASDGLAPLQVPVELGDSTFLSGAVIDTRVYSPLSDIAPAMQGDSSAAGMQHMAVVKDFAFDE